MLEPLGKILIIFFHSIFFIHIFIVNIRSSVIFICIFSKYFFLDFTLVQKELIYLKSDERPFLRTEIVIHRHIFFWNLIFAKILEWNSKKKIFRTISAVMTKTLIVSLLADVFVIPPAANGLNKTQKIVFFRTYLKIRKQSFWRLLSRFRRALRW